MPVPPQSDGPNWTTADQTARLALLAKQYGPGLDAHESLALDALTERLRFHLHSHAPLPLRAGQSHLRRLLQWQSRPPRE